MKKILAMILIICQLFLLQVYADNYKVGDTIGKVVETDIIAKINGNTIPSYNNGSSTVVFVRNLENCGFEVKWDEATRRVDITYNPDNQVNPMEVETKEKITIGKKIGDILYTDIKTYMNGILTQSMNVDNKTCILFKDLITFGFVNYDDSIRTATLDILDYKSVIAELQQYTDNTKTIRQYDTNYVSNKDYIEQFGIEEAIGMIEVAKGYIETVSNVNYNNIPENYKDRYLYYLMPGTFTDHEVSYKKHVEDIKKYKVIQKAFFVTDTSLVYVCRDNKDRVRGRLYIYCTADNNYLLDKKSNLLNGIWSYIDIEIGVANFATSDRYKWEHSFYTYHKTTDLSEYKILE